jgi:calcium-dependent protein kinase
LGQKNKTPFDDYKILETLGKGSFGEVKKVEHKVTKAIIRALKIVKKIVNNQPTHLEKIKTEIKILNSIDHPNILKLYEFYEDNS